MADLSSNNVSVAVTANSDFPPLNTPGTSKQSSNGPMLSKEIPPRSWADLAGRDCETHFSVDTLMLDHTPTVQPIFVNYKKVSFKGFRTPLIDIAATVGQVVGDENVDAIQPTRNGWQIYVRTDLDHVNLIASGMDVAGKHLSLELHPFTVTTPNVKIILKDLPLHEVGNNVILISVKTICPIASEVKYSNIWVDGRRTHLHNGDCFFYVVEDHVSKFDAHLQIHDYRARVIKPILYSKCSRCQQVGHKASADWCLT